MENANSRTYKYHYVTSLQYRKAYRFLDKWQQRWHRYERAHPCNASGVPVDKHAYRTISVGTSSTLEAMVCEGLDGKVGDPLKGFVVTDNPKLGPCDPYRVTVVKADLQRINLLADPLEWVRLSSERKRKLRFCAEKVARLISSSSSHRRVLKRRMSKTLGRPRRVA